MSVQAMVWVIENSESRLGPRHVMISIASHADKFGMKAWPSIRTIAKEARLSEREVQYAIPTLVKSGELQVERGAGPGGSHVYSLPLMRGAKFSSGAKTAPVQMGVQNPARNKEEQKQPSIKTSPNPAFQAGNSIFKLRHRDHTRIARWIEREGKPNPEGMSKIQGWDWKTVVRGACLELLIPFEDAVHDLPLMDEVWAARLELKKESAKVSA